LSEAGRMVCRFLRSRGAYDEAQGASFAAGTSSTEAYWCLRTMEAFGPDDGPADAHRCRSGRSCFAGAGG